jgi:hypothetical protein
MKDKSVSLSDIPRKVLKKKFRETNEPNADNSGFDRNSLLAIINNTNDANWSVDRDYKLINFNNAFSKMVKSMSGKTVGNRSDFFALGFTDKELARYKELYDYAFAGKEIAITEYNELPVMSWAELSFCPIRVGVEVVGAACNVHDVTESKFTEEKTINTRRLYEFISQTNQAITHTKDEKMLFLKVCNIAVDIGKFGLSWIGVPNVEKK